MATSAASDADKRMLPPSIVCGIACKRSPSSWGGECELQACHRPCVGQMRGSRRATGRAPACWRNDLAARWSCSAGTAARRARWYRSFQEPWAAAVPESHGGHETVRQPSCRAASEATAASPWRGAQARPRRACWWAPCRPTPACWRRTRPATCRREPSWSGRRVEHTK